MDRARFSDKPQTNAGRTWSRRSQAATLLPLAEAHVRWTSLFDSLSREQEKRISDSQELHRATFPFHTRSHFTHRFSFRKCIFPFSSKPLEVPSTSISVTTNTLLWWMPLRHTHTICTRRCTSTLAKQVRRPVSEFQGKWNKDQCRHGSEHRQTWQNRDKTIKL